MAEGREKIIKLVIIAVIMTAFFAIPVYAENTAYSGKAETAVNVIGVPYSNPDYTHASGTSDVSYNVIGLYDEPVYKELTLAPGDIWFKADTSYRPKIKNIKLDSTPLAAMPTGTVIDYWAADENGLGTVTCFLIQPDIEVEEYELYINRQLNAAEIPEGDCGHIKANEDSSGMFAGFSSVQTITLRGFDTKGCIKMDRMFSGCSALITIIVDAPDGEGHGFDLTGVLGTDGSSTDMFKDCNALVGGNGSTLADVHAIDADGYLTAVYARIDAYDAGDPSSLRGYFSDAPVMMLKLHYNDGSGKTLTVPVKGTEEATEPEEEKTEDVLYEEPAENMSEEKKEEQNEEVP